MVAPFALCLFVSAFLLFVVQPMAAKALLPLFGGASMVWTVSMLYFQVMLLLAYGYVYGLTRYFSIRYQQVIHGVLALISFAMLPILWSSLPDQALEQPSLSLLLLLSMKLSGPLFIVSSTAPLLQSWFSHTAHPKGRDPYFLYAASNLGSFIALLSYPFLIERHLGLQTQSVLWGGGFFAFFLMLLGLSFLPTYINSYPQTPSKVNWAVRGKWLFLSFTPVSLMLGVTAFITTDVASMPLFWIIPLALYLLTYVLTFASPPWVSHSWVENNMVLVLIFTLLSFIIGPNQTNLIELIIIHLVTFFMLSLLCHGKLVSLRPHPQALGQFYFFLALGGVLAGLFNGVIAPLIFRQALEYPIAILLAISVLPRRKIKNWWQQPTLIFVLLLINYLLPRHWGVTQVIKTNHLIDVFCLIVIVVTSYADKRLLISLSILFVFLFVFPSQGILWQGRNFYGIKSIVRIGDTHALLSQTTVHGFQHLHHDKQQIKASSYYAPSIDLATLYADGRIGIVGLGVGIIACQFDERARVSFYEIDPQVISLATDERYFSVLKQCGVNARVVIGDARLSLAKVAEGQFDLLILDAFNSDAIPSHLLTRQALSMYFQKLKVGGSLLVHITNRHINLLPVLASFGSHHNEGLLFKHHKPQHSYQSISEWVLISSNQGVLKALKAQGWQVPSFQNELEWSDDYSNLIPLLK